MEEKEEKSIKINWKKKIKENWLLLILSIVVLIILAIAAVYVFVDYVQITYPDTTIDQWSLDWTVRFCLGLILRELLFVGLPGGIFFGLGGYLWWRQLPADEKKWIKQREKKSHKTRDAAGGGGFFLFIAYCIYMAINGYYRTPFGDEPYSFWVFSYLKMIGWLLIILGIPGSIIGFLYFIYWLNKSEK